MTMRNLLIAFYVCALVAIGGTTLVAQEKAAPPDRPAVNLNTATADQLEDLPGIGRATAQRILEYRQKIGGFKKIEELMNVRGIGEKSFLRLKPLIVVTPPRTEKTSGQP
jgi:competence protein ComEA